MHKLLIALALALDLSGCRERGGPAEREAERIWVERCVRCHGAEGRGDGPDAPTLKKRPRDFSDRKWQAEEDDEELEAVILLGGKPVGYSAEMPPNPDLGGKPEVVRELVRKIRDLGKRSRE